MSVRSTLKRLRPRKLPFRDRAQRAAVAVIFRRTADDSELLFMERAKREGDPWSGHISFPGGVKHADDPTTCVTAMRETQEEVGLDLANQAQFRGRLHDVLTRRHSALRPMVVTPYLFELTEGGALTLNAEAVHALWVPVSFLRDPANIQTLPWRVGPLTLQLPCYYYQGRCIWGLTYLMLTDILQEPAIVLAADVQ